MMSNILAGFACQLCAITCSAQQPGPIGTSFLQLHMEPKVGGDDVHSEKEPIAMSQVASGGEGGDEGDNVPLLEVEMAARNPVPVDNPVDDAQQLARVGGRLLFWLAARLFLYCFIGFLFLALIFVMYWIYYWLVIPPFIEAFPAYFDYASDPVCADVKFGDRQWNYHLPNQQKFREAAYNAGMSEDLDKLKDQMENPFEGVDFDLAFFVKFPPSPHNLHVGPSMVKLEVFEHATEEDQKFGGFAHATEDAEAREMFCEPEGDEQCENPKVESRRLTGRTRSEPVLESLRPLLLWKSLAEQIWDSVLYSFWYSIDLKSDIDKQQLVLVEHFPGSMDPRHISRARLCMSPPLHLYSAELVFLSRLSGWRHYMQKYPFWTFFATIGIAVGVVALIILIMFCYHFVSAFVHQIDIGPQEVDMGAQGAGGQGGGGGGRGVRNPYVLAPKSNI